MSRWGYGFAVLCCSLPLFAGQNVWTSTSPPIPITSLLIDHNDRLYALSRSSIWRFETTGDWRALYTGSPQAIGDLLEVAIGGSGVIYGIGRNSILLRSIDDGATWTANVIQFEGHPQVPETVAADPNDPSTLYVGIDAGATPSPWMISTDLIRSDDGGLTWSATGYPQISVRDVWTNPLKSGALYASSWTFPVYLPKPFDTEGLFRSDDGGKSWTVSEVDRDFEVIAAAFDGHNPPWIYASTVGGLFRSTSDGFGWQPVGPNPPIDPYSPRPFGSGIVAIAVDTTDSRNIAVIDQGNRLWWSSDYGSKWSALATPRSITAIQITRGPLIHAGTLTGVYDFTPGPEPRRRSAR